MTIYVVCKTTWGENENSPATVPVKTTTKPPKTEKPKPAKKSRKLSYNEQKEYKSLERDIAKLEREKSAMEAAFATEDWTSEQINEQSVKLQEVINSLEVNTERWFELSMKLEG